MSYGVSLKNVNTGQFYFDQGITFNQSSRSGISTSELLLFQTIGFTAETISVNFSQFGNLIGTDATVNYSNINFDLNDMNFYGVAANMSKPTLVEICSIDGYEILDAYGVAQTIFSNSVSIGQKMIKNYHDPNNIYEITSVDPLSLESSGFNRILTTTYMQPPSQPESFCYVHFNDSNITKFFQAVPNGSNITWREVPGEKFYYEVDYYVTKTSSTFNGISLELSEFKQIIPSLNQTVLINNYLFDDTKSGLYQITKVQDKVYLSPGYIYYNHPGQTFFSKINLDVSSSLTQEACTHYVPYGYGTANVPYSKSLSLTAYTSGISSSLHYMPIMKDVFSESKMILALNKDYQFTKTSDQFKLGIALSNWCDDSVLFGIGLNYQIKEGY